MKKILFTFILFFAIVLPNQAFSLKGGVSETVINKGFFGIWHVSCKLIENNSSSHFEKFSVHIWNLSGWGNTLILENTLSGAKGEIKAENSADNVDGTLLKFTRVQSKDVGTEKITLTETPEITLNGNVFVGFDTFIIEKYENGILKSKERVKYKIVGQKIGQYSI